MNCEPLKKHIIDTVKEWQMKIGYRAESMKLYYPAASLAELLELPEDADKDQLNTALLIFARRGKFSGRPYFFRKGRPLESDGSTGGLHLDP